MVVSYESGKAKPSKLFISRLAKRAGVSEDRLKNDQLKEEDVLNVLVEKVEPSRNEARENEQLLAKTHGHSGTVPASKLIEVLEEQNAFLRRNFETSLTTILEVQQQAGNQLGALTWYSALVANGRDEKKAAADLSEIHNNIASFEGVGDEDDSSQTNDKRRTSAKRKVGK